MMSSDFQFALRFLNYKLFSFSRKGHGVHSPFVYNFIGEVIRPSKTTFDKDLESIVKWHKDLEKNIEVIKISEIGAGSRKHSENSVRVGNLVKKTGIRSKYGVLLWRMMNYLSPKTVIEFGTGMGISAAYLAKALPKSEIQTIEGDKARLEFAKKEFHKLGLRNIIAYNQNFDEYIEKQNLEEGNYAIVLDGNHRKEPTLKYFNYFLEICDDNSFIILDDINWSNDMQVAWKSIIRHPEVSISVDLFFMGIVFFRKGIPKQHFVVNY